MESILAQPGHRTWSLPPGFMAKPGSDCGLLCPKLSVAYFTKVNPSLPEPPLKLYGGFDELGLNPELK